MYHIVKDFRRKREKRPFSEQHGQGFFEYAIILGLVGLAVIGVVMLLRPAIADVFDRFVNSNAVSPPSLAGYTPPPPAGSTATPIPATVNLSIDVLEGAGGFTASPPGNTFETDPFVTVSIIANPDPGSEFVGWSGSVSSRENPLILLMDGDKTIHAHFRDICYTLNTTALGAGEISRLPQPNCPTGGTNRYRAGTNVQLQANVTTASSAFNGWAGDVPAQGMRDNPLTITMNANKDVRAAFTVLCYSLSLYAPDRHGTIVPDQEPYCAGLAEYSYGNIIALSPVPFEGYAFDHWGGDLTGSANPGLITMDADKSVEVYYRSNCYSFSSSVTGNGYIDATMPTVCPDDPEKYVVGTVELTAVPEGTDSFIYWSGDASGINPTISIPFSADTSVIANFQTVNCYSLTLSANPTTAGAANSQTTPNCVGGYIENTPITLIARPEIGQTFSNWIGGDINGLVANPVTYNILSEQSVVANFVPAKHTLSLLVDGAGGGTVTATPSIACPGTCSDIYTYGTVVTMVPRADANSTFAGWSGDIDCDDGQVTITANLNCVATFNSNMLNLDVTVNGNGTISSSPSGINCPGTCSSTFAQNTNITLTPTPASGYIFTGWSGDAACGTSISISRSMRCIANFGADQEQIMTIIFSGTGSGVVNLTQPNANCSANCVEPYYQGTSVSLTPTADYNSTFAGWSGDAGCGSSVIMPGNNMTCIATFNRINVVNVVNVTTASSSDDAEEQVSNGNMDLTSPDLEMTMENNEQIVGVRFQGVDVPPEATITNAYIIFTVDETDDVATSLIIRGQDSGDAPTFANTSWNISSRPTTSASADWRNVPEWSSTAVPKRTANLKGIVQEIIDRNDWLSGNSMAFIISGTGKRVADSTNGTDPELYIEYEVPPSTSDNFESNTWSGGTGDWNSDWLYHSNDAILDNQDSPYGSRHLRLRDDGYAERSADLSAYTDASLTFNWKAKNLNNSSDKFYVEIYDGSNWTEILTITPDAGNYNDNVYVTYSINLNASYLVPDFRIRFSGVTANGNGDYLYVDNIVITEIP